MQYSSLPEMDEMATKLDRQFGGSAALRVSAAGLGGRYTFMTPSIHYLMLPN
jgi:hypothetical protein